MGGDMGRDVQPARVVANPQYDPHWKTRTLGMDAALPVICSACGRVAGLNGATLGELSTHICSPR